MIRVPRPGERPAAIVAALVLATLLLVGTPAAALAHGELTRSDPPSGAVLVAAPARVRLWFSEPLLPRVSDARVWDQDGRRVDQGSAIDGSEPQELVVSLPDLAAGRYAVSWTSVSPLDGHILRGQFTFGVGAGQLGSEPMLSTVSAPWRSPGGLLDLGARWLSLLAALALFGAVTFQRVVLPKQVRRLTARRARRLGRISAAVLALGAVLSVVAKAVTLAVGDLATRVTGEVPWPMFVASRFGIATIVVVVLATLSWWAGQSTDHVSEWTPPAESVDDGQVLSLQFGLALLTMLALALSGHATTVAPLVIAIALNWVHLCSAGVWVGGIFYVALVLLPSRIGATALLATLGQFSPYAVASLGLLILTGLFGAVARLGTFALLVGSAYGEILLGKMLLVGALALLSGWHTFVLRPRLARRHWRGSDHLPTIYAQLVGVLRLELLLGVLVVLLAALLGAVPTAAGPPARTSAMTRLVEESPTVLVITEPTMGRAVTQMATPGTPGVADLSVAIPTPLAATTPDALAVLGGVDRAMNRLTALREENRLALTEDAPPKVTVIEYVAPGRMHFRQDPGDETIAIGSRRYDRAPGEPWNVSIWPDRKSFQWPTYHYARNASEVSVLRRETLDGEPVNVMTFVDRTFAGRYTLWVRAEDDRIRQERMDAPGHYMLSRYSDYDTPLTIDPPR